ncbi:AKAP7 2'5' RNA ligase-like domain-containing protein [Aspergillus pseudoustus]|uniref:AKAP7 2'5' RNA ligase-like domain-containing protein n=1 Tax=Aspergillus pseudoustus TaxID=1810923 RepID=A0ABR4L159_9EURO
MSTNVKPKRPPLTHFLCLPLINDLSLPQLESSLATFKASIPNAPAKSNLTEQQRRYQQPHPLIPDDAIRPVGTLHLTLGVMSLPTPERLNEALEFFQSLDLSHLLRTAGEIAARKKLLNAEVTMEGSTGDTIGGDKALATPSIDELSQDDSAIPEPFNNISLESLYALPRARSATILHAAPVDATSRLYPFCAALREKFQEAGFMQKEYQRGNATKPRPLLLHATIANTIYIRGRKRRTGGHGKDRRASQYTFDARAVVSYYRNFYLNDERTVSRSDGVITQDDSRIIDDITDMHDVESHSEDEDPFAQSTSDDVCPSYPFVWARSFPIEAVCICEMGAKKLDPDHDENGMNARLGEKYAVVAERSLDFRDPNQ